MLDKHISASIMLVFIVEFYFNIILFRVSILLSHKINIIQFAKFNLTN